MVDVRILLAPLAGLVLLGTSLGAQRVDIPADDPGFRSAARALAVVERAIAAHGGEARIRAVQDVSVRARGRRWMTYQSHKLGPPWDQQPTFLDLVMDFRNSRLMRHTIARYPVDFAFEGMQVLTPQGNFFYDPSRAGMGDVVVRFRGGAPVASHPARRDVPAFLLLMVRERAASLRYGGERVLDGKRTHALTYADGDGSLQTLYVDAATNQLAAFEFLRDDAVVGDQVVLISFPSYRDASGIMMPTRVIERRNGELVREDTLTITVDTHPADSLFAAPAAGYTETESMSPTGAEAEAIRKLADNVWLLQQVPGGNKVMFVAFRDYVLVFEAPTPQNAASVVMDAIRRTVPGKPVRYVTFSHHHDDHGAGLRTYIVEGVTIVTTPLNARFVRDIATARHTLRPDALSVSPKAAVVETLQGKRVFTDGEMTVELHDIGPTSHVNELVIAYFPKEKLVFQGDALIVPAMGEIAKANALTRDFSAALQRLGLDVQTIAGVHGRVGTIDDLRKAMR
jgi:glyoxylase-like metal-dependent hydrolase (beta-lactamase superfamily II)